MTQETQAVTMVPCITSVVGTGIKRKIIDEYINCLKKEIKALQEGNVPFNVQLEERESQTKLFSDPSDRSERVTQVNTSCAIADTNMESITSLVAALNKVQELDPRPSKSVNEFSIVTLKYNDGSTKKTKIFFIVPILGGKQLSHNVNTISKDTLLGNALMGIDEDGQTDPVVQGDEIELTTAGKTKYGTIVKVL